MKYLQIFFFALVSVFFSMYLSSAAHGLEISQNMLYKGEVVEVLESRPSGEGLYQELRVRLSPEKDVIVENSPNFSGRDIEYKEGDKVVLQEVYLGFDPGAVESGESSEDLPESTFIITDFYRIPYLSVLLVVFAVLTFLVGRKYGFYSLLGMGFSFFMIFRFILPQIIQGRNPVFVTILASLLMIPVSFYLSHGFSRKTHVAIASTVFTLILTVLFTTVSVRMAQLTGFSTDEAFFLKEQFGDINMRGILLAGIIIGFLGVLDDITISQASLVMQLKKANPGLGSLELYRSGMETGRDHITSMVNTLVLVYAGASLPLLLLFMNNPEPLFFTLNREIIADEVVRTLLGSIGLILAVPVSTFLAALVADLDV